MFSLILPSLFLSKISFLLNFLSYFFLLIWLNRISVYFCGVLAHSFFFLYYGLYRVIHQIKKKKLCNYYINIEQVSLSHHFLLVSYCSTYNYNQVKETSMVWVTSLAVPHRHNRVSSKRMSLFMKAYTTKLTAELQ